MIDRFLTLTLIIFALALASAEYAAEGDDNAKKCARLDRVGDGFECTVNEDATAKAEKLRCQCEFPGKASGFADAHRAFGGADVPLQQQADSKWGAWKYVSDYENGRVESNACKATSQAMGLQAAGVRLCKTQDCSSPCVNVNVATLLAFSVRNGIMSTGKKTKEHINTGKLARLARGGSISVSSRSVEDFSSYAHKCVEQGNFCLLNTDGVVRRSGSSGMKWKQTAGHYNLMIGYDDAAAAVPRALVHDPGSSKGDYAQLPIHDKFVKAVHLYETTSAHDE